MRVFHGRKLARRALVGTAMAATLATVSLALPGTAQADSVGKYIALNNNVIFNKPTTHTWTSTTVHLVWQSDGNLVLYCNNNGKVLWATGTEGYAYESIEFSGGQIAISGRYTWLDGSKMLWHAGGGNANDYAYVQNDGNFVIYRPNGGGAEWATGTNNKC